MTTAVIKDDLDQSAKHGVRPEVTDGGTQPGEFHSTRGAKCVLESKGHGPVERAIHALRVDLLRQHLAGMNPDDRAEVIIEATQRKDSLALEALVGGSKPAGHCTA